ncbi:hypothetical protein L6452_08742 [Arctium lappa]|uniref:Uncharacterized protein n=1 Tax=Arctium lappa TaxID=4217 RepID=A0ACB9DI43_ARCLA|nr:hypothetical protein L6452_08742 [Arctium lappa]
MVMSLVVPLVVPKLLAATPVQVVMQKLEHQNKTPCHRQGQSTSFKSHEPAPTPVETNDGGTSYNKKKPRGSSLVPSWNVKPSPDLNVDASLE